MSDHTYVCLESFISYVIEYVGEAADSDGSLMGDINSGLHKLFFTELFRGKRLLLAFYRLLPTDITKFIIVRLAMQCKMLLVCRCMYACWSVCVVR